MGKVCCAIFWLMIIHSNCGDYCNGECNPKSTVATNSGFKSLD